MCSSQITGEPDVVIVMHNLAFVDRETRHSLILGYNFLLGELKTFVHRLGMKQFLLIVKRQ